MNKNEAQKKIDTLEKELSDLRKIIEAPEKKGRWKPEKGEAYWLIGASNPNPFANTYICQDDATDRFNYNTGNCYKTKAEAEKALEILNRAFELIGNWEPDWEDSEQWKWMFLYAYESKTWVLDYYGCINTGGLYFPTKEAAQTMIDEFGDDLFLIMGRV